jgi:hypothetical protein
VYPSERLSRGIRLCSIGYGVAPFGGWGLSMMGWLACAGARNPLKNFNGLLSRPHETLRSENQIGYPTRQRALNAAFFGHSPQ